MASVLSNTHRKTFKYHAQRTVAKNRNPGANPATDVGLVLRLLENNTYVTKILYEYKPALNALLSSVDIFSLMELFLQCHYCLRWENRTEVVGCLTDLISWHYFEFKLNARNSMTISWYWKVEMSMPPTESEVLTHLNFVVNQKTIQP